MAILDVTYHSIYGPDVPRWGAGGIGPMGILPPQVGNSQQIDFAGGPQSGAVADKGLVAVMVADEDCRIAIGENVSATVQNSRRIVAGVPDYAYVPTGARVSVMAA